MSDSFEFLKKPVHILPGVGANRSDALEEAGIHTIEDLLKNVPFRYTDAKEIKLISDLVAEEIVTIIAEVTDSKSVRLRNRRTMSNIVIRDESDEMKLTYFNQPYTAKNLVVGESYAFTGKVKEYKGKLALTNPTYERAERERVHTGRIIPIYPQTDEVRNRWLRQLLYNAIMKAELRLPEYLPSEVIEAEGMMNRADATLKVHFPETMEEAKASRRRFAFDELWEIFEGIKEQERLRRQEKAAATLHSDFDKTMATFAKAAPFPLTESQKKSCQEIFIQLSKPYPIYHVVQGEVGSGKTLVAAFALLAAAQAGHQALYLAPTSILAQQHFALLSGLARAYNLDYSLWTSANKDAPEAKIIVGTHALLSHQKKFNPGLVIIDEEHRFGVGQREQFWSNSPKPHIMSMTATPIPRTLATILFGQQSTSFLDLIPGKEKHITTRVAPPTKLKDHFEWLQKEILSKKVQAFLIAPFIRKSDVPEFEKVMSADELYKLAKKSLPALKVALLTGETTAKQKTEILAKMNAGKIDVLVATPVIEVGIDISNAAIITITSAERFGLAQLHQLRGRVGRQGQESWCFLIPSKGAREVDRLKKLETLSQGDQLAELDLQNRGVGEFLGTRQSGWDTLNIASWLDLKLVKQVKRVQETLQK